MKTHTNLLTWVDWFGKRRTAGGNYDAGGKLVYDWNNTSSGTDRGYTGHEHLDDVGVIHMNGRIFDPRLGMFMQGDPYIQDPLNLQNFNRYTYCYNNPMVCTDPSGQFSLFGKRILPGLFNSKNIRVAVAIGAAFVLGPSSAMFIEGGVLGSITTNVMAQAAISGFVSGAISSGNLKGAVQGSFTAAMFAGAGNLGDGGNFFTGGTGEALGHAAIALHGVVGCVTSEASGGSCGSGALSAAFSKAMMPVTGPMIKSSPFAGLAISSIVGGTASVLGGGKFSNGATTAAFGYLYNALSEVARRNIIIGSTVLGGSAAVIGCTTVTGGACAGGALPVFAGGARLGFRFGVFAANLADSLGIFSEANTAPAIPEDYVGVQGEKAGTSGSGNRHTSGPLAPENGGTGDAGKDFDKLTGGTGKPFPEGDKRAGKPGVQIGDNGIWIRPGTKKPGDGPRIEIPGNGNKLPETLHY